MYRKTKEVLTMATPVLCKRIYTYTNLCAWQNLQVTRLCVLYTYTEARAHYTHLNDYGKTVTIVVQIIALVLVLCVCPKIVWRLGSCMDSNAIWV